MILQLHTFRTPREIANVQPQSSVLLVSTSCSYGVYAARSKLQQQTEAQQGIIC